MTKNRQHPPVDLVALHKAHVAGDTVPVIAYRFGLPRRVVRRHIELARILVRHGRRLTPFPPGVAQ